MDIIESIWIEYNRRVFTCEELSEILKNCGYSKRKIAETIREGINKKKIGVIKKKKTKKKPPPDKLLVIK